MAVRTVVTGGAGFIGSNLVDRLLREGSEVVVLDNFDPFYDEGRKRANLEFALNHPHFGLLDADIRVPSLVHRVIEEIQPDTIVHLAAKAGVRPSIDDPATYLEVNVMGTVHLLEAACRLPRKPKFIFASSSSVYGDREDAPFRESDRVDRPVSPYAASKKACELIAYTFHHLHGLPVTGLRFFTAYGPRNRPDLAIAKFTSLIDEGRPISMFGDGTTRRDYTYVDDVVDGIIRSIHRCNNYHIYNIGNSSPVELGQMIREIGAALGKEPKIATLPEQPGDVRQTYADISLARTELGYRPETPFAEGIRRYIDWYRGQTRRSLPS